MKFLKPFAQLDVTCTKTAGTVPDKGATRDEVVPAPHRHYLQGWLFLASAIVTEVIGTILLAFSEGFQLPTQTTATMALYAFSFYLLTRALRSLPLGVAYATWSGLGTVAVVLAGSILHEEAVTWERIAAIASVIGGIILLNFANRAPRHLRQGKDA